MRRCPLSAGRRRDNGNRLQVMRPPAGRAALPLCRRPAGKPERHGFYCLLGKHFPMIIRVVSALLLTGLFACSESGTADRSNSAEGAAAENHDTTRRAGAALELVFQDDTYQLTGVAKIPGGDLFVNYPRWGGPYKWGVVATAGRDSAQPYPDEQTNRWVAGENGASRWVCVQAVYADDSGTLWVLDPAAPQLGKIQGSGAKLVRMNRDGSMGRRYMLTGTVTDTSYANDVRVDVRRQYAYITDSKTGGIIVIDLASGRMREVLKAHPSTLSDPAYRFVIDGRELTKNGKPVKINSDGIALTPDGTWLYYKSLTDDKLYRIATEHLRNWNLSDTALGNKVEDLGHFTTTDGMIFDKAGNLYMGDLQHYSIVRVDKNLQKTVLVKDERLIWPDSYSIADGYLYISCSQINKQPDYNNGENKRTSPYTVYRLKL